MGREGAITDGHREHAPRGSVSWEPRRLCGPWSLGAPTGQSRVVGGLSAVLCCNVGQELWHLPGVGGRMAPGAPSGLSGQ